MVGHVKKKSKSLGGEQVPTLWTSADATAWKATVLPGKDSGNAVAQNIDGVTVVVENRAGGAGTGPGLLRSTDGVSWDALDFPAEPVTGGGVVSAGQVGLTKGGFALVSNIATPGASTAGSVWTSVDGATWQKAASAPFLLYAVAGGPTSSVFGSRVQLTTTDGITWQEVQRADVEWAIAAAATQDGAAVVVDGVLKAPPSLIVHAVPAVAALAPGVTPAPFATPQPTAVAATSDPLCDPILSPADVAAITGQQVVAVKGDVRLHPPGDFVGPAPDTQCAWTLASGDRVDLNVVYEWDDYAPDLQWADKLNPKYVPGSHKVKGLGFARFRADRRVGCHDHHVGDQAGGDAWPAAKPLRLRSEHRHLVCAGQRHRRQPGAGGDRSLSDGARPGTADPTLREPWSTACPRRALRTSVRSPCGREMGERPSRTRA